MRVPSLENRFSFTVISDIHANLSNLSKIVEHAHEENRAIVCAGDFLKGYLSDREDNYEESLKEIEDQFELFANIDSFIIPGNHDSQKLYEDAVDSFREKDYLHDIHKSYYELNGFYLTGWGGIEATEKYTDKQVNCYSPDEISAGLGDLFHGIEQRDALENTILVTHQPVKGYISKTYNGYDIGSDALREVYEKYKDIGFVISGHSHQAGIAIDSYFFGVSKRNGDSSGNFFIENKATEISLRYDKNAYNVTCFLNPASLGYDHSYANYIDVDVRDYCNMREIEIHIGKIDSETVSDMQIN